MNILEQHLDKAKFFPHSLTNLGTFIRPKFKINDFFKELSSNEELNIEIDDNINVTLMDTLKYFNLEDEKRVYTLCHAGEEQITDYQIIPFLDIKICFSIEEIFVNAVFLICEDLKNKGPLYELSLIGQENINIGYYLPKNEKEFKFINVVWLERIKPVNGGKRVYHIHNCEIPRKYKPFRHLIAR